jgi:HAD superfamily hydrolase (TIGR01548 family)
MSELFVKQELVKILPQLDALLLDIDGVILDVAQTFRVVSAEVTQWYATEMLRIPNTGPLFHPAECELFKNAGGFNNDWDLTNAVVALVLAKKAMGGNDTAAIREMSPTWEQYTDDLKRRGGGPVVAEKYVLELLTPGQRRDFANDWNPRLVTRLFQEMYAGDEACKQLYGFTPEHIHGKGYLEEEPVLLDANLLPSKIKIGVLTGRTKTESQIALKRANVLQRIPESSWVTETDGVRKPSGESLALLQERMGWKTAIYVGDTLDDLRTVQNFRDTRTAGKARCYSCQVLSGPAGNSNRRPFLEAGAEVVSPDINTFLGYLNNILK